MANITKNPQNESEYVDNPGQTEFDKIVEHGFMPGEEKKMEEQAGAGTEDDAAVAEAQALGSNGTSSKARSTDVSDGSSADEPHQDESLYRKPKQEKAGFIGRMNGSGDLKKYLIIGGFGAAFTAIIILLFSFLNVFKLDGLMSAIEQRAFLRTNATLDTRSSKWLNAYVEARMLDMGDNPNLDNPDFQKDDNLLFRANRVDTNSPFSDWYRTLRASKFEQEVFEKHGIKFTSMVTADGKFRPGLISINGEKPIPFNVSDISTADFKLLSQGDVATIQKFGDIVDTKAFSGNKAARAAIKDTVKKNTRWDQMYKRRALRKDIQNMTGVKDWRFFETSRDSLAQKHIDIRTKIIDKMVPDTNLLGQVTRCLFGVSDCKPNRDVAAPQNKFDSTTLTLKDNPDTNTPKETENETKLARSLDAAGISDALKKLLVAANIYTKILNIPSTLDMITYVNKNLSNLVKLVVIARGAQAAGLFQVFETSRDQIKTGQVTSSEVNDFMDTVSTAGSSDAQVKVIDGKGDPSVAHSDGACSQEAQALAEKKPAEYKTKYGVYAPLCADQRIESADNAQTIQVAYDSSIGLIVGPIASAWQALKSTPIIGQLIGLVEWFGNLINKFINTVFTSVLNALGLQDNVNAAIAWVFGKLSNFLGLTILKGYESPGTIYNWLVQGGAYTAESASRQQGAALTNPVSQAAAQKTIAQYESSRKEDSTLFKRVADLSNPDSLAYKSAYALSGIKSDPSGSTMASLNSLWQNMGRNFGLLFGKSLAATPNGYSASKFAGIETYDYPQQCYDLNPITATPEQGTNIQEVLGANKVPISDLTWDLVSNSDKFYSYVYQKIGDVSNADDIAIHIYNCNLLDTAVRGSLGYIYGYTKDNADLVP